MPDEKQEGTENGAVLDLSLEQRTEAEHTLLESLSLTRDEKIAHVQSVLSFGAENQDDGAGNQQASGKEEQKSLSEVIESSLASARQFFDEDNYSRVIDELGWLRFEEDDENSCEAKLLLNFARLKLGEQVDSDELERLTYKAHNIMNDYFTPLRVFSRFQKNKLGSYHYLEQWHPKDARMQKIRDDLLSTYSTNEVIKASFYQLLHSTEMFAWEILKTFHILGLPVQTIDVIGELLSEYVTKSAPVVFQDTVLLADQYYRAGKHEKVVDLLRGKKICAEHCEAYRILSHSLFEMGNLVGSAEKFKDYAVQACTGENAKGLVALLDHLSKTVLAAEGDYKYLPFFLEPILAFYSEGGKRMVENMRQFMSSIDMICASSVKSFIADREFSTAATVLGWWTEFLLHRSEILRCKQFKREKTDSGFATKIVDKVQHLFSESPCTVENYTARRGIYDSILERMVSDESDAEVRVQIVKDLHDSLRETMRYHFERREYAELSEAVGMVQHLFSELPCTVDNYKARRVFYGSMIEKMVSDESDAEVCGKITKDLYDSLRETMRYHFERKEYAELSEAVGMVQQLFSEFPYSLHNYTSRRGIYHSILEGMVSDESAAEVRERIAKDMHDSLLETMRCYFERKEYGSVLAALGDTLSSGIIDNLFGFLGISGYDYEAMYLVAFSALMERRIDEVDFWFPYVKKDELSSDKMTREFQIAYNAIYVRESYVRRGAWGLWKRHHLMKQIRDWCPEDKRMRNLKKSVLERVGKYGWPIPLRKATRFLALAAAGLLASVSFYGDEFTESMQEYDEVVEAIDDLHDEKLIDYQDCGGCFVSAFDSIGGVRDPKLLLEEIASPACSDDDERAGLLIDLIDKFKEVGRTEAAAIAYREALAVFPDNEQVFDKAVDAMLSEPELFGRRFAEMFMILSTGVYIPGVDEQDISRKSSWSEEEKVVFLENLRMKTPYIRDHFKAMSNLRYKAAQRVKGEKKLECLDQARRLHPSYEHVAAYLSALREHDKEAFAKMPAEQAVGIVSEDLDKRWLDHAKFFAEENNPEAAGAMYEKALSENPKDYATLCSIVQALTNHPKPMGWISKKRIYGELGNTENMPGLPTIEDDMAAVYKGIYDRTGKVCPAAKTMAASQMKEAYELIKKNDYKEALPLVQRAWSANPEDMRTFWQLIRTMWKNGQSERAAELFEQTDLRLGKDKLTSSIYNIASILYEVKKDHCRAICYGQKALELHPESKTLQRNVQNNKTWYSEGNKDISTCKCEEVVIK